MIKIPLDVRRFAINNNFEHDMSGLIDGDVSNDAYIGSGQLLNPFTITYEFPQAQKARIEAFRFYNIYEHTEEQALKIWAVDWSGVKTLVGKIFQHTYQKFVEVPVAPVSPRFIILELFAETKGQSLPRELEFWGSCSPYTDTLTEQPAVPFKQLLGVNTYEWNLIQDPEVAWISYQVYEPKWDLLKHFRSYRHYCGWRMMEPEKGMFTFQPTKNGAWFEDVFYERLASDGRQVVACLKNNAPDWFLAKHKVPIHAEMAPADPAYSRTDPKAYAAFKEFVFQFVARYGRNKDIPLDRIKVWQGSHPDNEKKVGLATVHCIEILNEMDAWWRAPAARLGYMTSEEYGVLFAECYDAAQEADPTMDVVIGGTAQPDPDWHKGVLDWWQANRKDPFPSIAFNYHIYSGGIEGIAPEVGVMGSKADRFDFFNQVFGGSRELWVTETGYDIRESSPFSIPNIPGKTVEQTQADWIIRTLLLLSQKKHHRCHIFQLFDDSTGTGTFASSGVANWDLTPRIALTYIEQIGKVLGEFAFDSEVNVIPRIHKYVNGDDALFVAWMHDGTFALALDGSKRYRVKVYQFDEAGTSMTESYSDTIQLTETPIIYKLEEVPLIKECNFLPLADAGQDIEVLFGTTVTLNAADSIDTDGEIVKWKWTRKGPRNGKISYSTRQKTTVTGLGIGEHTITLQVWDDNNGTAADTLRLIVK